MNPQKTCKNTNCCTQTKQTSPEAAKAEKERRWYFVVDSRCSDHAHEMHLWCACDMIGMIHGNHQTTLTSVLLAGFGEGSTLSVFVRYFQIFHIILKDASLLDPSGSSLNPCGSQCLPLNHFIGSPLHCFTWTVSKYHSVPFGVIQCHCIIHVFLYDFLCTSNI